MVISPEDWLVVEHVMEQSNHTLLQAELTETETPNTPQLLMISLHAVQGTTSAATFSVVVVIGGKRGLALIDSGNTDTFMDYAFASKCNCQIIIIASKKVKVAGGAQLDSCAITRSTTYFIQQETFSNEFKLLQLKGYDIILGCDWNKAHNPISIDLRDNFRQLIIYKNGTTKVVFYDFTTPPSKPVINSTKLQKLCRAKVLGYVIQINLLQQQPPHSDDQVVHPDIASLLESFEDIFSEQSGIPPSKECDHETPLKENSKPPNLRPYRVPHKQKEEVERLIQSMLQDAIIRPSSSPYSSPAILVRKKDGSWRLCIDYMELNSQAVKNKFPIPVIEDLLDEFCGAEIFSKPSG
jgi:hypothetical protein